MNRRIDVWSLWLSFILRLKSQVINIRPQVIYQTAERDAPIVTAQGLVLVQIQYPAMAPQQSIGVTYVRRWCQPHMAPIQDVHHVMEKGIDRSDIIFRNFNI